MEEKNTYVHPFTLGNLTIIFVDFMGKRFTFANKIHISSAKIKKIKKKKSKKLVKRIIIIYNNIQSKVEIALLPEAKNFLKLSLDACLFPNLSNNCCWNILA